MRMLRDTWRRLRDDQSGFTMIAVVSGMMVIGMFSLGAYAAATGDIQLGRKDQDRKRALAAAKAGIEWYTYHLLRDTNYWTYCNDSRVVKPGVSLQGMNRPPDAWRTLPNSDSQFQVELMTADNTAMSQSQCLANPATRILNGGVLKIRATGRSNGQQRQLVATFRRNSFLDYLWYTKWETPPPAAYDSSSTYNSSWAATNCNKPRNQRPSQCTSLVFGPGDVFTGPLHTEDSSFLLCGKPQLGRNPADNVEIALATSPSNAFSFSSGGGCSGSGTGNVKGSTIAPARSLDLPPSNATLKDVSNISLSGQTCLVFNSDGTVTAYKNRAWSETITCSGGDTQTYTLSENNVIYVDNAGACTQEYQFKQHYNDPSVCGNVAVSGTYTKNVTIGAANDIIVNANLVKPNGGDQMMGLIGQNFVRIYHPAAWSSGNCTTGYSGGIGNTKQVGRVDAAVLSLQAAFMVDNYSCGSELGDLTIFGNIAQRWRGGVGTVNTAGYDKDYVYDDRLKFRQPPEFLDPLKASWHLMRQSEQSPVK